uniref:Uncharacterized protein n=1 Tax=Globodera rostochiensis TaxID=31243 RepID=A0A914HG63_GLORO
MSDNTSEEEQQQQMKEIFICADIWLDVFAFFSPRELGLKVALISDRFDRLVDEHFKTRKWSLGTLQILPAFRGNGAQIYNGNYMPIPQGPLPNKVIGFEWISIRYIDGSVIEFLQRLRRLFNSSEATVAIFTFEDQSRSWDIIRQKIWPLISDNICGFLLDFSDLGHLRQLSPTVLRNCTKLRSIEFQGFLLEFPADDNADASSAQALAKWLLTPRQDGRPKILDCGASPIGDLLKEAFVNASERANFIIRQTPILVGAIVLGDDADEVPTFELRNNLTRERLTFRPEGRSWLLVRSPIERDEDKWAKWEREAMEWKWDRQRNLITIDSTTWTSATECLTQTTKAQASPRSEWTDRGRQI